MQRVVQQALMLAVKSLAPLARSALRQGLAQRPAAPPTKPPGKRPASELPLALRQPPPPPPPSPAAPTGAATAAAVLLGLSASFALGFFAARSLEAAAPPAASSAGAGAVPGAGAGAAAPAPPSDAIALGTGLLQHTRHGLGYTAEFDAATRNPRWVAERLTRASLAAHAARRSGGSEGAPGGGSHDSFAEERSLPPMRRARLSAYAGSGLDRGHMAAAAAHRSSAAELADTFSLSNCAPQDPQLNRAFWAKLERWSRELLLAEEPQGLAHLLHSAPGMGTTPPPWEALHIVTGPLYLPTPRPAPSSSSSSSSSSSTEPPSAFAYSHAALGAPLQWMPVPTHFFKVVLATGPVGAPAALAAFLVPNAPLPNSTPLTAHLVPLGVLEAVSGLSFFPAVLGEEEKGGGALEAGSSWGGVALGNAGRLLLQGQGEVVPAAVVKALGMEGLVVQGRGGGKAGGAQQSALAARNKSGGGGLRHLCDVVSCSN